MNAKGNWAGVLLAVLLVPGLASADVITLKSGEVLEGIIKKVEKGQVTLETGFGLKTLDILEVDRMEFDTPHLIAGHNVPVDHFLKNTEAQEIVKDIEALEKTADEIRKLVAQINAYWAERQPIDAKDTGQWAAAKETFRRPLSRYQELLNDLYFHVLSRVDEYNGLMQEATKVYVGVKGVRAGSSLVPPEFKRLPLKKYVPGAWYDTIYYEGYNMGYDDAYVKFNPRQYQ